MQNLKEADPYFDFGTISRFFLSLVLALRWLLQSHPELPEEDLVEALEHFFQDQKTEDNQEELKLKTLQAYFWQNWNHPRFKILSPPEGGIH